MSLQPLTREEQQMAEEHISIVDMFLKQKRLDPNEYYDVVIFGYLEAVQRECRNPLPPDQKNFVALCCICMERKVLMEHRYRQTDSRAAYFSSISFDEVLPNSNSETASFTLHDVLPDPLADVEKKVVNRDLVSRILAEGTNRQLKAINLICMGYAPRECAEIMGITNDTARRTLCNFRGRAKAVAEGKPVIKTPGNASKRYEAYKRYKATHREQLLEQQRLYRAKNRDRINDLERKRRRTKRAALTAAAI